MFGLVVKSRENGEIYITYIIIKYTVIKRKILSKFYI